MQQADRLLAKHMADGHAFPETIAMVLWGLPLAIIGVVVGPAAALVAMLVMGIGNSVGDVAYITMLQRAVPEERIAQVFGGLESVLIGSIAVGGLVSSLLVEAFGAKTSLIASGLVLPVLTALVWIPLRRIDSAPAPDARVLALLQGIPMFAVLNTPSLERLALAAARVTLARGATVFGQGDPGDRYYVIAGGTVEVFMEGRFVRTMGRAEGFGEIALLADAPRTATVIAATDVDVFAIARVPFLTAVTGHDASRHAAWGVARGYGVDS